MERKILHNTRSNARKMARSDARNTTRKWTLTFSPLGLCLLRPSLVGPVSRQLTGHADVHFTFNIIPIYEIATTNTFSQPYRPRFVRIRLRQTSSLTGYFKVKFVTTAVKPTHPNSRIRLAYISCSCNSSLDRLPRPDCTNGIRLSDNSAEQRGNEMGIKIEMRWISAEVNCSELKSTRCIGTDSMDRELPPAQPISDLLSLLAYKRDSRD